MTVQCDLADFPTVFPSGDIHILTKSRVSYSLEDLKTSQDFDGVGC